MLEGPSPLHGKRSQEIRIGICQQILADLPKLTQPVKEFVTVFFSVIGEVYVLWAGTGATPWRQRSRWAEVDPPCERLKRDMGPQAD